MNEHKIRPPKGNIRALILLIVVSILAGVYFLTAFSGGLLGLQRNEIKEVSYGEFLNAQDISNLEVKQTSDNRLLLDYKLKSSEEITYKTEAPLSDEVFKVIDEKRTEANFDYKFDKTVENNFLLALYQSLIFIIPMLIIGYFIFKMTRSQAQVGLQHTKSRAKLQKAGNITYKDVAGYDEEKEELQEVVDFLKEPKKYFKMGARIPKGILLSGPPGTGKTLLARATAGEAGVKFFTVSGSEFLELYVGVGASRVRDMFAQAQANAPAIIFIDEVDAIGRQRGAGVGGGNDEREQTLNQILVEMDGFDQTSSVVVIAATNRPDVLDPALLRPGRFDRQIIVNLPDIKTRKAILELTAKNKPVDDSINLGAIAKRTPGFSGAELENVLNEAALLAARQNKTTINAHDVDEAIDRVMMGPAKKSKEYTEKERRLVAYHEAGHAVVGLVLDEASIVQKITIIPRGQAGGYNLMTPKEETYFATKQQLFDQIAGFLGGRVAEEVIFGDISSGAQNDIQNITKIARAMVTELGMSNLGPIQYEERDSSVFLGRELGRNKNFSSKVGQEIDAEVRAIIEEQHERVRKIIAENRGLLTAIAERLLEKETIVKEEIETIAQDFLSEDKLAKLNEKNE